MTTELSEGEIIVGLERLESEARARVVQMVAARWGQREPIYAHLGSETFPGEADALARAREARPWDEAPASTVLGTAPVGPTYREWPPNIEASGVLGAAGPLTSKGQTADEALDAMEEAVTFKRQLESYNPDVVVAVRKRLVEDAAFRERMLPFCMHYDPQSEIGQLTDKLSRISEGEPYTVESIDALDELLEQMKLFRSQIESHDPEVWSVAIGKLAADPALRAKWKPCLGLRDLERLAAAEVALGQTPEGFVSTGPAKCEVDGCFGDRCELSRLCVAHEARWRLRAPRDNYGDWLTQAQADMAKQP